MPPSNRPRAAAQPLGTSNEANTLSPSVANIARGTDLQTNGGRGSATSPRALHQRRTDRDHLAYENELLQENRELRQINSDLRDEKEAICQQRDEIEQERDDGRRLIDKLRAEIADQKETIGRLKADPSTNMAAIRNDLEIAFPMIILNERGSFDTRMCRLDTGSPTVNLVTSSALEGLSVERRPYQGMPIVGIGGRAEGTIPKEQVQLQWHVRGKHKTYKTWFTVWEEETAETELGIDILLGRDTIAAERFLIRNTEVYLINEASAVNLPLEQNGGA